MTESIPQSETYVETKTWVDCAMSGILARFRGSMHEEDKDTFDTYDQATQVNQVCYVLGMGGERTKNVMLRSLAITKSLVDCATAQKHDSSYTYALEVNKDPDFWREVNTSTYHYLSVVLKDTFDVELPEDTGIAMPPDGQTVTIEELGVIKGHILRREALFAYFPEEPSAHLMMIRYRADPLSPSQDS